MDEDLPRSLVMAKWIYKNKKCPNVDFTLSKGATANGQTIPTHRGKTIRDCPGGI